MRLLLSGLEERLEHLLEQRFKELSDQQKKLMEQMVSGKQPHSPTRKQQKRTKSRTTDPTESQSSFWLAGSDCACSKGRKKAAPSLLELESAMMQDLGVMRATPSDMAMRAAPSDARKLEPAPNRMQSGSGDIASLGSGSMTSLVPRPVKVEPPKRGPALLPGSTGETEGSPGHPALRLEVDELAEEDSDQAPTPEAEECKRGVGKKLTQFTDKGPGMQEMNRDSQACILVAVDCQPIRSDTLVEERDWQPYATNTILRLPKVVYYLIAFLTFCQVASTIAFLAFGYTSSSRSLSFSVVSSMIYGLVAICCVCLLKRSLQSEQLKLSLARLHEFVADFEVNWHEVSGKEWRKFALAWLLSVACFTGTQGLEISIGAKEFYLQQVPVDDVLNIVMLSLKGLSVINFAIASAIVMIVAYIQSHLLIGLDKSLDCWCCEIWNHEDFELGVQSWNAMQALLKSVGRELQNGFLALQAFGYLSCVLFLGGAIAVAFRDDFTFFPMLVEVLAVLPLTILFLVNLRVFSHAAGLTEKCRAIPAFVNQIMAEEAIERNRQYLVQFIKDSSAGFYVKNVQLTQEMFAKQIYISGTVLSGLIGLVSRVLLA